MSHTSETVSVQHRIGAITLYSGVAVWALILLDVSAGLPVAFPRTWYLHRELWVVTGLALFAIGWKLQRSLPAGESGWTPGLPGKRFRRLVVFSRPDCHLCDEAKAVLAQYLDYLPDIEEIDVDTRRELQERFGTSIPVVEIDGEVRFRGRVDEVLLRRLLEATAPISSGGE